MRDLTHVLDALDEAVGAATQFVEPEVVEEAALVARRARRRLGFLGDSLVVALVGGTGSGKSSLLNALAGEEVAATGVLRPTTQQALAWMPFEPEPGLVRLLDDLGVEERRPHHLPTPLCVLDMPDVDSVAGSHRAEVERLLPQVDAVVWVLDPEKYNDRVVHQDFLAHLTQYEAQFVFVLNQIDRIFEGDRPVILDDLGRQLRADGFHRPRIMATAAAPPLGDPQGVEALRSLLEQLAADKRLIADKLLADAVGAARRLEEEAGLDVDIDWPATWEGARTSAATLLTDAALDGPGERAIIAAGRSEAMRRHPLGVLGAIRRRRAGRALGMDHQVDEALRGWEAAPGAGMARRTIGDMLGTLAGRIRGAVGRRIAQRFDDGWAHQQLETVMDRSLRAVEVAVPRPVAAGWLGWLGLIASIVGAVWWWTVPPGRGEVPWHLVVLAVGVAMVVASRGLVRWLADRRTGRAIAELRSSLQGEVMRHLDSLIAAPIRSELRDRAELRAALAAVSLAAADRRFD